MIQTNTTVYGGLNADLERDGGGYNDAEEGGGGVDVDWSWSSFRRGGWTLRPSLINSSDNRGGAPDFDI